MATFAEHQTNVLNYASQPSGGDAEVMVKSAINNTYRRVLSSMGQDQRQREFIVNVLAPEKAEVTGSNAGTFSVTEDSSDTLKLKVDNGVSQTVTLTAGTRTTSNVVDDINDQTTMIVASVSSLDKVTLKSNSYGMQSEVEIESVSNNAYTILGFSTGTTNGTNSPHIGLPLYVRSQLNLEDPSNATALIQTTRTEFLKEHPVDTDTGDPTHYIPLGNYGIQVQPAVGGSTITVVSDSASDSATTYTSLYGKDSNGTLITEKLTMNGTTNVTSSNTFYPPIDRIVKHTDANISFVGNITVTDASSNVLARIPTWVASPTYQWIEFLPIPDTARSYTLTAMAFKPDLVNDHDWPDFDDQYHDLLDYGAGQEVLPSLGKPDLAVMLGDLFDQRFKEFKTQVDPRPDLIQTYADVTIGNTMPNRPWIEGVDRGLATGE